VVETTFKTVTATSITAAIGFAVTPGAPKSAQVYSAQTAIKIAIEAGVLSSIDEKE
jgi:hypothetical protein